DSRFESNEELAKFLGGLTGTLTFVSILIKTFVYGPLMKNYGLKISLLVSPIIVSLVTIGAALVGSLFGYTIASAAFTFFFLLISLAKLFQKALKDSIEGPSLKMIYQSLDPSIRYEVQARVDGTINEIAALASGVFLTALSVISFIHLIHYTYFLIGIILVWFVVTFRLYRGYRRSLEETLTKSVLDEVKQSVSTSIVDLLKGYNLREQISIIELSKPWLLKEFIAEKLFNVEGDDLAVLLSKIEDLGDVDFVESLERISKHQNNEIVAKTIAFLKQIVQDSASSEKINQFLVSKNFEERIYAAKLLGATRKNEMRNNLTFLFRDLVPSVKIQAIRAAKGSRSKELITFLIDFLDKDQYAPYAHTALINTGETGLEMLELALQRTNTSAKFKERILRLIPETGSRIASN
ncbi:MAG TPA: hypothetical protein PKM28_10200, partial [Tenuifilaceae bacterium]|nr:hypothetical protein [Tenuifilaceae bacterium]